MVNLPPRWLNIFTSVFLCNVLDMLKFVPVNREHRRALFWVSKFRFLFAYSDFCGDASLREVQKTTSELAQYRSRFTGHNFNMYFESTLHGFLIGCAISEEVGWQILPAAFQNACCFYQNHKTEAQTASQTYQTPKSGLNDREKTINELCRTGNPFSIQSKYHPGGLTCPGIPPYHVFGLSRNVVLGTEWHLQSTNQ